MRKTGNNVWPRHCLGVLTNVGHFPFTFNTEQWAMSMLLHPTACWHWKQPCFFLLEGKNGSNSKIWCVLSFCAIYLEQCCLNVKRVRDLTCSLPFWNLRLKPGMSAWNFDTLWRKNVWIRKFLIKWIYSQIRLWKHLLSECWERLPFEKQKRKIFFFFPLFWLFPHTFTLTALHKGGEKKVYSMRLDYHSSDLK